MALQALAHTVFPAVASAAGSALDLPAASVISDSVTALSEKSPVLFNDLWPSLVAAFTLIFVSEIGDKTFFISALLSMKYPRRLVFLSAVGALSLMTAISALIGQIFHALPGSLNSSIPFDDLLAAGLLVFFGIQNIRAGLRGDSLGEQEEEEEEAKEEVDRLEKGKLGLSPSELTIVAEVFSLIFLAEWGDKSMISTIALSAAKNPWGVVVGGSAGHAMATILAIGGGSLMTKYISEQVANILGGVLFLVFAGTTVWDAFAPGGGFAAALATAAEGGGLTGAIASVAEKVVNMWS